MTTPQHAGFSAEGEAARHAATVRREAENLHRVFYEDGYLPAGEAAKELFAAADYLESIASQRAEQQSPLAQSLIDLSYEIDSELAYDPSSMAPGKERPDFELVCVSKLEEWLDAIREAAASLPALQEEVERLRGIVNDIEAYWQADVIPSIPRPLLARIHSWQATQATAALTPTATGESK